MNQGNAALQKYLLAFERRECSLLIGAGYYHFKRAANLFGVPARPPNIMILTRAAPRKAATEWMGQGVDNQSRQ